MDPALQLNDVPLIAAAKAGDKENVLRLIGEGGDVNAKNNAGSTPLHWASINGHVDVAKVLIDNGADVSAKENGIGTPLHYARHVDVAKLLNDNGADVNAKNRDGLTPLHIASIHGHVDVVKFLIDNGADVNANENDGDTPLHYASAHGRVDVAKLLNDNGADVNAKSRKGCTPLHYGLTPLHYASEWGHADIVKHLMDNHVDLVKFLIDKGADVNAKSHKGCTPLLFASGKGHVDVVNDLIDKGADVNAKSNNGWTPLHFASQNGHVDVVKFLIDKGADTSAKENCGFTPLHIASKYGRVEVARILVLNGTELKHRDWDNQTVLDWALQRGNDQLAEMLTDASQVHLMQEDCRRARNFEMVRTWRLLQAGRAVVGLGPSKVSDVSVHCITENMEDPVLDRVCPSKRALVRAMTLPAPLVQLVASYIPLPLIWEKRLALLTSRSRVDPNSAICNALDLIKEVFEAGGVLDVFEAAPPSDFANYLQVIAGALPSLTAILTSHPYFGGHFDSNIHTVANGMVALARTVVMWCESSHLY